MSAYGSYAPMTTDVYSDSSIVAYVNCGTSVLCGFAVRSPSGSRCERSHQLQPWCKFQLDLRCRVHTFTCMSLWPALVCGVSVRLLFQARMLLSSQLVAPCLGCCSDAECHVLSMRAGCCRYSQSSATWHSGSARLPTATLTCAFRSAETLSSSRLTRLAHTAQPTLTAATSVVAAIGMRRLRTSAAATLM